jgi:Bacteriocin-protection, YdeI or OmpD-Associated/Domain of unknown function (DUF1905)
LSFTVRDFGATGGRWFRPFSVGSIAMKFTATVIPSGNATGIEVPRAVMKGLGSEARPLIAITINGHTWRSRIALMRGLCLVGISAANRVASGIATGDVVAVEIITDLEPRLVSEPPDLASALRDHPKARAAFDRQPFGLKRQQVADITAAKAAATRQRRIAALVSKLRGVA